MFIVNSKGMRAAEENIVRDLKITLRELMEKAGEALAEEVFDIVGEQGRVVIVSGRGNNGGDGFVAARVLSEKGVRVTCFTLCSEAEIKAEAKDAFLSLKRHITPKFLTLTETKEFEDYLSEADVAIDAIFGIGFKGKIEGFTSEIVNKINSADLKVVSADIPSGMEADTGQIRGVCVKADKTVTFIAPKIGLFMCPGAEYVGELVVADLGLSSDAVKEGLAQLFLPNDIRKLLPIPSRDTHKKARGRVLVIAGSRGMTGAAALTAKAALRAGAGLVVLGVPESLNAILEQKLIEVMTLPLPETDTGSLDSSAFEQIIKVSTSFDAVALGPGLSLNAGTISLVQKLIDQIACPVVLDADGLNAFVGKTHLLKRRSHPTIVTPHPGELARLFEVSAEEIQRDRLGYAKRVVPEWGVAVVLKGAYTIIGVDGFFSINITGNWGMATAGTGDVLTGIIGSFIAQGLSLFEAAVLGTYLHGFSGDLAAEDMTRYCLIASDLINYLPEAVKKVLEGG
ncbi:MAG TPA: NAD(P)H-hydrate dehydratase [Actinobacteria bacterium]|nr:NAD(P)H-hydrate dehydratase [Actinomycetota bacterium]